MTDDPSIVCIIDESGVPYVPAAAYGLARERITKLEKCLETVIQALIDAGAATHAPQEQ